jgi:hypothetical protein
MRMPDDILAFFERYREAFDRLDGDAVARLYCVPSGIVSDRGYAHWATFEPIRDNMVALCDLYRDHGFASTSFVPAAFIDQGPERAVADLAWTIRRCGGQPPWRFHTTYNLVRTADGWRVLLCTAYEEKRLDARDSA